MTLPGGSHASPWSSELRHQQAHRAEGSGLRGLAAAASSVALLLALLALTFSSSASPALSPSQTVELEVRGVLPHRPSVFNSKSEEELQQKEAQKEKSRTKKLEEEVDTYADIDQAELKQHENALHQEDHKDKLKEQADKVQRGLVFDSKLAAKAERKAERQELERQAGIQHRIHMYSQLSKAELTAHETALIKDVKKDKAKEAKITSSKPEIIDSAQAHKAEAQAGQQEQHRQAKFQAQEKELMAKAEKSEEQHQALVMKMEAKAEKKETKLESRHRVADIETSREQRHVIKNAVQQEKSRQMDFHEEVKKYEAEDEKLDSAYQKLVALHRAAEERKAQHFEDMAMHKPNVATAHIAHKWVREARNEVQKEQEAFHQRVRAEVSEDAAEHARNLEEAKAARLRSLLDKSKIRQKELKQSHTFDVKDDIIHARDQVRNALRHSDQEWPSAAV